VSDRAYNAPIYSGSVVFTICASNYLGQASVLAASLSRQYPGMKLAVFLLDGPMDQSEWPHHMNVMPASAVLDRADWNQRRCHYDMLEFATCIKAACFLYLFAHGATRAAYFDPDIVLFKPIDFLLDAAGDDAEVILTPHILTPMPDDGCLPSDLSIMRSGIYNLGFVSMRNTERTRAFLGWWDNHLRTMCRDNIDGGLFTDQKWMDFTPSLVEPTKLLRHPGCNVAYWNLHERMPRHTAEGWKVEGPDGSLHDLIFFHFSGFNPNDGLLSKHETRIGKRSPGDTPTLLADYAKALLDAGHTAYSSRGVPAVRFACGATWDPLCRALYRQAVADRIDFGDPLEDDAFLKFAAGKTPSDHLSRYMRTLMRQRGDIAAAYQDGRNVAGFAEYLRRSGTRELGIDPALLELLGVPATAPVIAGINFVGYLRSHLGVGQGARNHIAAFESVGIDVTAYDLSHTCSSPTGHYALPITQADAEAPAITVLFCNADVLPEVLEALPSSVLKTYRIGCWAWETPEFPEQWCASFDLLDEIWVSTNFIADAVRAKATVPVMIIPEPMEPPEVSADRAWVAGLIRDIDPAEFLFLFQFDVQSFWFRKNPEGAIAAFVAAFSPDEPVRLIIKLLNSDSDPALLGRLRQAAAGHRVSFFEQPLESLDRYRLLASVDCFVSLHRAEGFGLSIVEAMAYRVPVVVTGWSGNADFTTADNAALVAFDLKPTEEAHGPYPAGTVWAEPRLDDAARQMRRVYDDPIWREAIASAGASTVAAKLSYAVVGAAMRDRLQRLSGSSRVTGAQRGRSPAWAGGATVQRKLSARIVGRIRRLGRIGCDIACFPGYYLARLPRLPSIIGKYGLKGSVFRAAEVAEVETIAKRGYRLDRVLKTGAILSVRDRVRRVRPSPPA